MSNEIINSVKRLERVGSETSIVTEKLKNSCEDIARAILTAIRDSGVVSRPTEFEPWKTVSLPYLVRKRVGGVSEPKIVWVDSETKREDSDETYNRVYLHVTYHNDYELHYANSPECPDRIDYYPNRDTALAFSELINAGFIDKVATWIDRRNERNLLALSAIEKESRGSTPLLGYKKIKLKGGNKKITLKEIKSNLCWYDKRNPDSILSDDDSYNKKEDCFCDNCFCGRTRLAEELLKRRKYNEQV